MSRLSALLLLLSLVSGPATAQTGWTECKLDRVKVLFPKVPEYHVGLVGSMSGPVLAQQFLCQDGGCTYVATCGRLPEGAPELKSPDEFLADCAQRLLTQTGGERLAYRKLGQRGAELDFRLPSGQQGRVRYLLAEDVFVSTLAVWQGQPPQTVGSFFGSIGTDTAGR